MKLNELAPALGSRKRKKRIGRGPGGTDKTSGRGHKGQQSRSGSSLASSGSYKSQGGQTPFVRRLPKRGFHHAGQEFHIVNVSDLAGFASGEVVTGDRLIKKLRYPVKLLGRGEIQIPLQLVVEAASKAAVAKIEQAGGSVLIKEAKPKSTTRSDGVA